MAMNNGKWVGGPNWVMVSRFGSRKSNSGTNSRGKTRYACGTERAYIGDIQREIHASWKARQRVGG